MYNDTNYHCVWSFNCRRPPAASTVLQFLAFNRDDLPIVDCDSNFVEIREGLALHSLHSSLRFFQARFPLPELTARVNGPS